MVAVEGLHAPEAKHESFEKNHVGFRVRGLGSRVQGLGFRGTSNFRLEIQCRSSPCRCTIQPPALQAARLVMKLATTSVSRTRCVNPKP